MRKFEIGSKSRGPLKGVIGALLDIEQSVIKFDASMSKPDAGQYGNPAMLHPNMRAYLDAMALVARQEAAKQREVA